MGVINHNCVIATTWNEGAIAEIREWVNSLDESYQSIFAFTGSLANNESTVVMTPDCSKEGWDTSDKGDALRAELIRRIEQFDYEDGSNPFSWVEVSFGEYGQCITQGNNKNVYSYRQVNGNGQT